MTFLCNFRYYGLWIWFPELFHLLEVYSKAHPGEAVSVCDVTGFKPPGIKPETSPGLEGSNTESPAVLDNLCQVCYVLRYTTIRFTNCWLFMSLVIAKDLQ